MSRFPYPNENRNEIFDAEKIPGRAGRCGYMRTDSRRCVYNNESFAKCQGLLGGNPGGRAFFRLKRGSDIRSRLAAGTIPQSLDDVCGEEVALYWKGAPFRLDAASVWATNLPNFAGYGDPLDRDPAPVGRDLSEGKLTVLEALEVYGVVADATGKVDGEKTLAERAVRREQRLGSDRGERSC